MVPDFEVFALRYATVQRQRRENFIADPDPHEAPMPMDYFVWVLRGAGRVVLVDTGFNRKAAEQRRRHFLRCPIESLSLLGIAAADVEDVILTHLHYDHAGNIDKLPNARFHLQEGELHYAVGRYMAYKPLRHSFSVLDLKLMVERVYDERVTFYNGDAEFAPGIELLHIGGHTQGLQAVRVHTERGWIVLASDASHFYDNICCDAPFPIVHDVGAMLAGFRTVVRMADGPDHVVPGHDPQVLQRFEPLGGGVTEVVALHRLVDR
jgi:glyoxylase-like metal-dependent hydrolase (beta-lactamase superfamily II)